MLGLGEIFACGTGSGVSGCFWCAAETSFDQLLPCLCDDIGCPEWHSCPACLCSYLAGEPQWKNQTSLGLLLGVKKCSLFLLLHLGDGHCFGQCCVLLHSLCQVICLKGLTEEGILGSSKLLCYIATSRWVNVLKDVSMSGLRYVLRSIPYLAEGTLNHAQDLGLRSPHHPPLPSPAVLPWWSQWPCNYKRCWLYLHEVSILDLEHSPQKSVMYLSTLGTTHTAVSGLGCSLNRASHSCFERYHLKCFLSTLQSGLEEWMYPPLMVLRRLGQKVWLMSLAIWTATEPVSDLSPCPILGHLERDSPL